MRDRLGMMILLFLTCVSICAYAFFDFTWWIPVPKDAIGPDGARSSLIFILHIAGILIPSAYLSKGSD